VLGIRTQDPVIATTREISLILRTIRVRDTRDGGRDEASDSSVARPSWSGRAACWVSWRESAPNWAP